MKAVFHIGTTKTGTTSLQRFLDVNRERLIAQGFLYTPYMKAGRFGPEQPEYMRYVFSKRRRLMDNPVMAQRQGFRTLEELDRMVEGFDEWLAGQAATEGCHSFVVSSELIWADMRGKPAMRALHQLAMRHFDDVRYVIYIRRQDKWLASAYSETLRNTMSLGLDTFLARRQPPDYHGYIRRLADVVGEERITVRLFERGVMKGDDAVEDFCAVAGIDAAGLERPARVNEGLTRRAAGVLRRLNALAAAVAKPGSGRHARLTRAARRLALSSAVNTGPGLALTPAQRDRVLAECAQSNERLRQWLFPERRALFDMSDIDRESGAAPAAFQTPPEGAEGGRKAPPTAAGRTGNSIQNRKMTWQC